MPDTVTNELIYETLKQIQGTLSLHAQYLLEIKERVGLLEQQYASLSRRVDRMDERLDRVEKRLNLADA